MRTGGSRTRPHWLTEAEAAACIEAYRDGDSIATIARRLERDRSTVRKALVRAHVEVINGAERARRWPVDDGAFAEPLSNEARYWVGFLAADGCVIGTQVNLGLMPSSRRTLERFLLFVGSPNRPLRSCANGRQLMATVHSKQLTVDLARHGVVPRKSNSMTASPAAAARFLARRSRR